MNLDRAKVIINNLLSEVVNKSWEAGKQDYMDWLELEVGINKEELQELADSNCLPMPIEIKEQDEYEM